MSIRDLQSDLVVILMDVDTPVRVRDVRNALGTRGDIRNNSTRRSSSRQTRKISACIRYRTARESIQLKIVQFEYKVKSRLNGAHVWTFRGENVSPHISRSTTRTAQSHPDETSRFELRETNSVFYDRRNLKGPYFIGSNATSLTV